MEDMLTNLATYGYIFLFLYSLGGGFVALIAAGVLSYAGKMDITTAIAIAFVANVLGDTLLFYMARYHKSEMMNYFRQHRRKLALSHVLMKKHGSWIVVAQKFVYGIKTLIPLAIGLTKYDFMKFTLLNTAGAALWALVFGLGSFYAGELLMRAYEAASGYPYAAPVVLLTILGLIWLWLNKATKKRS